MNFSSQYRYLCSDQSSIVLISHVIYPRYIFYIYFSIFYLYRTFFFLREKKRNNNSLTDLSFSNVTKKGIVLLNFNLSSLNINILLTACKCLLRLSSSSVEPSPNQSITSSIMKFILFLRKKKKKTNKINVIKCCELS